jgi:hypothetical protein
MDPKFSLSSLSNGLPYKNKAELEAVVDSLSKAGLK